MTNSNKFPFVTNLRATAVVMVVLYHCLCPFTPIWNCAEEQCSFVITICAKFINSISMPLFFAIAGYLFAFGKLNGKYSDICKFIFAKFNRLLLPFIFWGIVVWTLLSQKTIGEFLFYGASHLWFLGTLFFMFIVFSIPCLMRLSRNADFVLAICLLFISVACSKFPFMGTIANNLLVFCCYFFVGILFAKYEFKIYASKVLLILMVLILAVLTCFYEEKYVNTLIKLFSFSTLVFIFYNGKIYLNRSIPIARKIEKECMGIYILHHILLQLAFLSPDFESIYTKFRGGAFLMAALLLLVCYIISVVARKTPFNKVLG